MWLTAALQRLLQLPWASLLAYWLTMSLVSGLVFAWFAHRRLLERRRVAESDRRRKQRCLRIAHAFYRLEATTGNEGEVWLYRDAAKWWEAKALGGLPPPSLRPFIEGWTQSDEVGSPAPTQIRPPPPLKAAGKVRA